MATANSTSPPPAPPKSRCGSATIYVHDPPFRGIAYGHRIVSTQRLADWCRLRRAPRRSMPRDSLSLAVVYQLGSIPTSIVSGDFNGDCLAGSMVNDTAPFHGVCCFPESGRRSDGRVGGRNQPGCGDHKRHGTAQRTGEFGRIVGNEEVIPFHGRTARMRTTKIRNAITTKPVPMSNRDQLDKTLIGSTKGPILSRSDCGTIRIRRRAPIDVQSETTMLDTNRSRIGFIPRSVFQRLSHCGSDRGRVVGNPDITQFWGCFRGWR